MSTFITNVVKFEAFDKRLRQEGTLLLQININIQGNHLKGPVPVSISYEALFCPAEKYWEVDTEYPDEEPNPVHYMKKFETENERQFYVDNFYEKIA